MARWRVEYDHSHRVWVAYPTRLAVKYGWAFYRWRDAFDYAYNDGKRK